MPLKAHPPLAKTLRDIPGGLKPPMPHWNYLPVRF